MGRDVAMVPQERYARAHVKSASVSAERRGAGEAIVIENRHARARASGRAATIHALCTYSADERP
jgi:hypothetical protein